MRDWGKRIVPTLRSATVSKETVSKMKGHKDLITINFWGRWREAAKGEKGGRGGRRKGREDYHFQLLRNTSWLLYIIGNVKTCPIPALLCKGF